MVSDFRRSIGSCDLNCARNKGTGFASCAFRFQVGSQPALLTKKLSTFLSRLNVMCGGRENMCLVSGSLRRILKFLSCKVLWMVGKDECNSVGFFVR